MFPAASDVAEYSVTADRNYEWLAMESLIAKLLETLSSLLFFVDP